MLAMRPKIQVIIKNNTPTRYYLFVLQVPFVEASATVIGLAYYVSFFEWKFNDIFKKILIQMATRGLILSGSPF